jgi:hypothetical protein
MQGLQGKVKKLASLGHYLEPVLANSLLKHSAERKPMMAGLNVKQLHHIGLVQKTRPAIRKVLC